MSLDMHFFLKPEQVTFDIRGDFGESTPFRCDMDERKDGCRVLQLRTMTQGRGNIIGTIGVGNIHIDGSSIRFRYETPLRRLDDWVVRIANNQERHRLFNVLTCLFRTDIFPYQESYGLRKCPDGQIVEVDWSTLQEWPVKIANDAEENIYVHRARSGATDDVSTNFQYRTVMLRKWLNERTVPEKLKFLNLGPGCGLPAERRKS